METETWKPLKDIVTNGDNYSVSTQGRLRNDKTGNLLKPAKDKDGYQKITLHYCNTRKYYRVHRLVALAFIFNPSNKPEVNHKDGVKDNNDVSNLEWCTNQENIAHACETELRNPRGGGNGRSKLTDPDVVAIKQMMIDDEATEVIAKLFNVSFPTVQRIRSGASWDHIKVEGFTPTKGHSIGNKKRAAKRISSLTEEQVLEIRARYKPKVCTSPMLAKEFGVSADVIVKIVSRRTWKHLP